MRALLAGLFILIAATAHSSELPALFHVTGVATDDVLNIRQSPSAAAPIVGQFAPTASGIEVSALDAGGKWGRINTAETTGWVSMRYLQASATHPDIPLAPALHCHGTEPFWSLDIRQGSHTILRSPEAAPQVFPDTGYLQPARGRPDRFALSLSASAAAVIRRADCSDGMSDRMFGLEIDLLTGSDPLSLHSGCCALGS